MPVTQDIKAATVIAKAFGQNIPAGRQPQRLLTPASWFDEYPRPIDYEDLLASWSQNPYHQRAILVKVTACVGLGWQLLRDDEPLPSDDPAVMAWQEVWPLGFEQEMLRFMLDFELFGQGYLEVIPGAEGALACYRVPAVTVYHTRTGYRQRLYLQTLDFPVYDGQERGIYALCQYDPGASAYGVPDWIAGLNALQLDAKATTWNRAFFTNNAMPAWAIFVKNGTLDPDSEAAIKKMFDAEFKGETQAHRALLLSANTGADIAFEPLQPRPSEMGFENLKNISRDEIIAAHGVPPRLLGVVTPGQLGGGGEMTGQFKFFAECVVAIRQHLVAEWLRSLLPADLTLRFQMMDVTSLQEDAEYYERLINAGVLLPNEIRAELGHEPLPGADEAAQARRLSDGF